MTQPEVVINQMTGEASSVVVDNKHNIAALTHPDGTWRPSDLSIEESY